MNTSNITTAASTRCAFLQANANIVDPITFATYHILMPLRFIIGLTNQSIALTAFRKQSGVESSYTYQIFVSVAKIVEICEFTIYVIFRIFFAGVTGISTGMEWYMSSYTLMIIAANILIATQAVVATLSLALSTSMAVDRAFAMVKPFVYRNLNKKRHQTVALIICLVIACGSSLDYPFRSILVINQKGMYTASSNPYYNQAVWTSASNYLRIAIRLTLTAVLIVSNALSLILYKKRIDQLKTLGGAKSEDQKQEARRRKHEKTLFALTVFQAPFMAVAMILLSMNSMGVFVKSTFSTCEGNLVLALSDIAAEVTDIVEFYVILAVSKEFRKMVVSVLPFCRSKVVPGIITVSSAKSHN